MKLWRKKNAKRFDNIMLKTKTVGAEATPEGIKVQFEGLDGSKSEGTYDLVLQAVGCTPNGKTIHPHPTLGESIGMAAEVAHGSCTDLPPAKK